MTTENQTWLTKQQAASYLSRSTKTIERLTNSGRLLAYRYGGSSRRYYLKEDLDALFEIDGGNIS
jgi:excisionase family DNA binding protein